MANRIILNETSYFGAGAIREIVPEVRGRGAKKVLVVTDNALMKAQVATKVTQVLDEGGVAYEVYDKIKPNPTIENVQEGVAACKRRGRTSSSPSAAAPPSTRARPSPSS